MAEENVRQLLEQLGYTTNDHDDNVRNALRETIWRREQMHRTKRYNTIALWAAGIGVVAALVILVWRLGGTP